MVNMRNLEPWIFGKDQLPKGRALRVESEVSEARKCGFEFREPLSRRVWARKFFLIQCERTVCFINWNETAAEVPRLDGRRSALLTQQGKRIEIGARNAFECGDGIGAYPLMGLRVAGTQPHVACVHQQRSTCVQVGGHRHHFATTCDDDILHARHDRRRCQIHRGDARAAEAVQRYS